MSFIRYEVNGNSLKIINTLTPSESPDFDRLNTLNRGEVQGLLPIVVNQSGGAFSFECTVSGLFPLAQIFSAPVTRFIFTDILSKTVSIIENCERNVLNPDFLDLSPEKMFINTVTGELFCLYWPIINGYAENPPRRFFSNYTNMLTPNQNEDISYFGTYQSFLKSCGGCINMSEFKALLQSLSAPAFAPVPEAVAEAPEQFPIMPDPETVIEEVQANAAEPDTSHDDNERTIYGGPNVEEPDISPDDNERTIYGGPNVEALAIKVEENTRADESVLTVDKAVNDDFSICNHCGKSNKNNYFFCVYCGNKIAPDSPVAEANVPEAEDLPVADENDKTVIVTSADEKPIPTVSENISDESNECVIQEITPEPAVEEPDALEDDERTYYFTNDGDKYEAEPEVNDAAEKLSEDEDAEEIAYVVASSEEPAPVVEEPDEEGIICQQCGFNNKNGYSFCIKCGNKLAPAAIVEELAPVSEEIPEVEEDERTVYGADIINEIAPSADESAPETPVSDEPVICAQCGNANKKNYLFCVYCGNKLSQNETVIEELAPVSEEIPEAEEDDEHTVYGAPIVDIKSTNQEFTVIEDPVPAVADTKEEHAEASFESEPEFCFCCECGAKNNADYSFCTSCGSRLVPAAEGDSDDEIIEESSLADDGLDICASDDIDSEENTVLGERIDEDVDEDEDEDDVKTVILPHLAKHRPKLCLFRLREGEKIEITKPLFRIGKEKKSCDYAVTENPAISRNHLDIISRDGKYYVIDLGTTNGTYIDGNMLPPQCEVEVIPNVRITLADEDFVLYIDKKEGAK